jgi:hypothetical protein
MRNPLHCENGFRFWLAVIATVQLIGCRAVSLERQTVNQALSNTDLRYQMVLDNLAIVAAHPGAIPSFSAITDQQGTVTDGIKLDSNTAIDAGFKSIKSELVSINGSQQPQLQWTTDPVASPDSMLALQAACQYAICGSVEPGSKFESKLKQYQVLADLQALNAGWLRCGRKQDADRCACYVAHCGNTYVWVSSSGMKDFSEFTLILMDIATVDTTSLGGPAATVTANYCIDGKSLKDSKYYETATAKLPVSLSDDKTHLELSGQPKLYSLPAWCNTVDDDRGFAWKVTKETRVITKSDGLHEYHETIEVPRPVEVPRPLQWSDPLTPEYRELRGVPIPQ